MTDYFPVPKSQDEFKTMCATMAKTEMVPKAFRNHPADIYVAAMWGSQLGLAPIVAVQNIAVINGKPAIYGDLAKAVCYRSGLMTAFEESVTGEGRDMVATCRVKRKGDDSWHETKFSMADAARAGLTGKAGPWTQYPRRMLQMRARGFALRDVFPDVLAGLITAEEAQDYPTPEPERKAAPQAAPAQPAEKAPAEAPADVIDAEYEDVTPAQQEPDTPQETAPVAAQEPAAEQTLDDRAFDAAVKGTAAYRDFFMSLSNDEKRAIGPRRHNELKAIAEDADIPV